jgi:hypothetical protein
LLPWQRQATPSKISMRAIKIFFFSSSSHCTEAVEISIKAQRDFVSTPTAKENERRACNQEAAIFVLIALAPLQ